MEEISKALPRGYWVWEARRGRDEQGKGRWVWSGVSPSTFLFPFASFPSSLSSPSSHLIPSPQEKYKVESTPPLDVDGNPNPPPSLDSIPLELFDYIASFLGKSEHLALCRVSFRFLELASALPLPSLVRLDSKWVASFLLSTVRLLLSFNSRGRLRSELTRVLVGVQISSLPPPKNRISPLLHALRPSQIVLNPQGFDPSHLASLPPPGSDTHPIPIDYLYLISFTPTSLSEWSPILHLLDPRTLTFLGVGWDHPNQAPTVFRVAEDDRSFDSWTRLRSFGGRGQASVPILEGSDGTFPLFQSPASAERGSASFRNSGTGDLTRTGCSKRATSYLLCREKSFQTQRGGSLFYGGVVEEFCRSVV